MNVFLTGGTGFIGTHAARALAGRGHRLTCLARRSSNIRDLENLGADIVFGDVRDRRPLASAMAGCDALVHLAGACSFWEHDRGIYSEINVRGTRNVMECALETGIPRVIHVSTLHVYGKPVQKPFTEESMVGPVRFSEYARSKYEAERIAWGLHIKKGLPLVVCHPATALGPRRPGRDASFIRRLLGAAPVSRAFMNSVHAFVHVQDIAEAFLRLLDSPVPPGQRYFISGGCMSIRRLMAMAELSSGTKLSRGGISRPSARIVGTTLTAMAGILKKPPLKGLSSDYIATLCEGTIASGAAAARDLGLVYTPLPQAVTDEVKSIELEGVLSDKRRTRRYPLNLEIVYKAQGDENAMSGYIMNISTSGMFLVTHKAYPRGRYISANLFGNKPGEYFMARGRVVRTTPGGIAVDFILPHEGIRNLVSSLQRDARRQAPA